MTISKSDWKTKFYLSKVPNVNLLEKFQILFLSSVSNSVIKKLKLDLAEKEKNVWHASFKFENGVHDLLDDFGIKYDIPNVAQAFIAKTDELIVRGNVDNYIYPEDKAEIVKIIYQKIEKVLQETQDIKIQTERIKQAYSDSKFTNLFRNSSTEAYLIKETFELIFIKRTISNALNTSEFVHTLKHYPVLNLKEFKMLTTYDNGQFGYNIVTKRKTNSEEKLLFINEFHLLGLDELYRRKWLGRILANEILQIAIEDSCSEIRGEIPLSYMEDPIHKERLIGFWTNAGYTIYKREIKKIIDNEIILNTLSKR